MTAFSMRFAFIEFALTDVSEAVDVGVTQKADGVALPVTDSDIKGKRFGLTQNGVYTLTVDTLKAFPKGNRIVGVQADLTVSPQSDKSKEVIYKIFDLRVPIARSRMSPEESS